MGRLMEANSENGTRTGAQDIALPGSEDAVIILALWVEEARNMTLAFMLNVYI